MYDEADEGMGAKRTALDELMKFAKGGMGKEMAGRMAESCPKCGGKMEACPEGMKCAECGELAEGAEAVEGEPAEPVPGAESEEAAGKVPPEKLKAMLERMRAAKG